MRPILRNIQNNDPYEFLGDNKFKNLRTGNEGHVDDAKAKSILKINAEATLIINEYPLVEELIKAANLKFEK